jgi:superfamily II DNA or RNA helicase
MTLKSNYLIENKHSPDVFIKMLYLKYPETDTFVKNYRFMQEHGRAQYHKPEDYGKNMFQLEKEFIISYEPRIDFISALVKKLGGNALILFINVKDQYGQRIKDRISDWNPDTYYIDGGVGGDARAEYKDAMEKGSTVALVASYATFATGIDLKNVNHIIFAESYKSEVTIRQAIGRGMRKLEGKVKVTIYDLIDDLQGYIVKHGKARQKIYEKEKFVVTKHDYDLAKFIK